jgi:hypothetical protein
MRYAIQAACLLIALVSCPFVAWGSTELAPDASSEEAYCMLVINQKPSQGAPPEEQKELEECRNLLNKSVIDRITAEHATNS